jgi:hypothetical protein
MLATLLLACISAVSGLVQTESIVRTTEDAITQAEALSHNSRQQVIGDVRLALFFPSMILFLIWIYCAYKNLALIGPSQTEFSAGWAIGGFFIPLVNLTRPAQVVREIWIGSCPGATIRGTSAGRYKTPALVAWWWALFLTPGVSRYVTSELLRRSNSLGILITASLVYVFSDILVLIDALLVIKLTLLITKWQNDEYSARTKLEPRRL